MPTKFNYTPSFFLAALWPGWMSVVFFMYLMFIIPRDSEKFPIPTFDTIISVWNKWDIIFQAIIIIAILWIIYFAMKHFQMLYWNLKEFFKFKKTEEFNKLKKWNWEISLMTIPLTLAMTINVLFILWAIFIPWIWNIIEYLFPIAIIAFSLVWILAFMIFMDYFIRLILKHSDADFVNNNSLSQMLSVFAFVMIWVWFSASAAMSEVKITIFLWLLWSWFFITISLFLLLLKMTLWFKAILEHWIDKVASPSLWIIIPILTLIGITIVRQSHWLHDGFWVEINNISYLMITIVILSLQIFFWYIWYKVMKVNSYFQDYLYWKEKNAWVYALVCPWVALSVFLFFFLHLWLVKNWIIEKFGIIYIILLIVIFILQAKTISIILRLNSKFFTKW